MSAPITMQINPKDIARLDRTMRDLQRITKKSMPEVVKISAVTFAHSAARRTPQSKKYAEVIDNPAYSRRKGRRSKGSELPFLAIRYNSKSERRLVPTKSRRGDAALIRTRGAAKAVWVAVAWRLRQGGKPSGEAGKVGVTYSAVSQVEKGESSSVQISTNLRYMKKLDTTNNIVGGAIGAAGRALNRELKNLGQAWTRRWGS